MQFSCKEEVHREILFTYENSNPKIIAEYTDEQNRNNQYLRIQFYPNGIKSGEGLMINEKQNGVWKYYDEKGNLIAENVLEDNKQIDSITCWYPTGELSRKIIELRDPTNRWLAKDFYRNGQLKILTFLKNAESPDSMYVEYYSNGNKKEEGLLDNTVKNGIWNYYDSTGVLIETIQELGNNYKLF